MASLFDQPEGTPGGSRVQEREGLVAKVALARKHGARIVLANGCFEPIAVVGPHALELEKRGWGEVNG